VACNTQCACHRPFPRVGCRFRETMSANRYRACGILHCLPSQRCFLEENERHVRPTRGFASEGKTRVTTHHTTHTHPCRRLVVAELEIRLRLPVARVPFQGTNANPTQLVAEPKVQVRRPRSIQFDRGTARPMTQSRPQYSWSAGTRTTNGFGGLRRIRPGGGPPKSTERAALQEWAGA